MAGNIIISAIIILGIVALMAGTTNPFQRAQRQRLREDQMASEKPFQMGADPNTTEQGRHRSPSDY